ncbi:MAG TPA: ABC transporter ATP-binding protein, partial [Thermoanaerobaculia bacterium]|nr:ABC transporter ATP-binding protein [Thermoanaerobaculia bacterium]
MTAAIEIVGVHALRGGRAILSGATLAVMRGEVLAVAGASGSGKTTLLRLVLGFEAPDEGTVSIEGVAMSAPRRILVPPERRGLAVVFQDLALWPHLSVAGNLEFALRIARVAARERRKRVDEILERVGLSARRDCFPGVLSGGERQRVAIARAMVQRPRAVLLDEPLANLDVALKKELLALFRDVLRRDGTTTILVTHDPVEACALANRIALLEQGSI